MSLLAAIALIASQPVSFDPVAFFRGSSRGEGQLKVLLKNPRTVRVESKGIEQPDGSLLLDQRVAEQGKPVRIRQWRLKRLGPNRFVGTLTDAAGPVAVDLIGARARIRYRMKNGLHAEQWLTPRPDGRSVTNVMRVRKAGIVVARFEEVIRKLD